MFSKSYKRWRHTRGYGVHSPFAFFLINEVINSRRGYSYYGEEELDNRLKDRGRKQRRFGRLIMRLAARLDVGSAFISENSDKKLFESALTAANSKIALTSAEDLADNSRLIITRADHMVIDKLEKLLERPGRILLLTDTPKGWRQRLFDSLEEGLMFYGKRNLLLINRPTMQKVAYSIKL